MIRDTEELYTPPRVFEELGLDFDVDPCSPHPGDGGPIPWVPARRFYTEVENGLLQPWDGRVWLHPPADVTVWLKRFIEHGAAGGTGIAFLPARTAEKWFHRWATRADAVHLRRGRAKYFHRAKFKDGRRLEPRELIQKGQPGVGQIYVALGLECVNALKNVPGWTLYTENWRKLR